MLTNMFFQFLQEVPIFFFNSANLLQQLDNLSFIESKAAKERL